MTFSNVNVFKSAVLNLKSSEPGATATKIVRGGAFAPNTQEAIAIMRSDVDNQWENSYITKYQALMQNRLNRLRQELTNAYKSILEVSTVQQVRENGATSSNSALTDIYGRLLPNSNQAFKSLEYYDDSVAFEADDANNESSKDGVPSYYINMNLKQYDPTGVGYQANRNGNIEMRKLYVTGPALQVTNSMKVSFRTEEVPPKYVDTSLLGIPLPVGDKAFLPGQKVAEYSAEVKAGGFFSTLNYLYNFSPRELKYTYPTSYSTTTEESGSRQTGNGATGTGVNTKQAVLFEGQILDGRDVYESVGQNEDTGIPGGQYDADGNKPPTGSRIKFTTSNPNEGYQAERSPVFEQKGGDVNQIDTRSITRRVSDNDAEFDLAGSLANGFNSLKSNWVYNDDTSDKITIYGAEDRLSGAGSIDDKIKWVYNHDGIGAADMNQDGAINGSDIHEAKALFVNHYQVTTQTVELNSSSQSYGVVKAIEYDGVDSVDNGGKGQKVIRSAGIDGTAEHVLNDSAPKDQKVTSGNDSDGNPLEKIMLAGSSKIATNFDGKFVSNLYNLTSFNGQNIATDTANVNINSKNDKDKVVIAEYEGFQRAINMDKGLADDYFSQANSDERTEDDAMRLRKKIETEINATSMVDSDWHYSEYKAGNNSITFRNIEDISFKSPTGSIESIDVEYKPQIRDSNTVVAGDFNNVVIGFRKPFKLDPIEFQTANYSPSVNSGVYINTPTYQDKDVFVDVVTNGATTTPDLIVNGNIVPRLSIPVAGTVRYNLKGFLKEGDNVIGAQVKFDADVAGDSFKIMASPGLNNFDIENWLDDKVSTDRATNGDNFADKLSPSNVSVLLSSWQSKMMVSKIDPAFFDANYPPPAQYGAGPEPGSPSVILSDGSTYNFNSKKAYTEYKNSIDTLGSERTATRVKENNSFARILTETLNKKEYQDVFNLGLLNVTAGKTLTIKAQISAPTGGSVNATMDIQYDPLTNKFVLVQNKFDAFGGA